MSGSRNTLVAQIDREHASVVRSKCISGPVWRCSAMPTAIASLTVGLVSIA